MVRAYFWRLTAIVLSFCVGLLVFYVPERNYRSVDEVWLPTIAKTGRDDILSLPVKTWFYEQRGVRFLSEYSSGPEIIEVNQDAMYQPSRCPDFYAIEELSPSKCAVAAKIGGSKVYTITRRQSSPNINAYMTKGSILIAVSGFDSKQETLTYLRTLTRFARRNVDAYLNSNKTKVEKVVTAIQREKRNATRKQEAAYKYIPFTPVVPAILPAGWVQQMVRVSGKDPTHPTRAEIYYKKGRDRFVRVIMVPKSSFTLGATCGPTPGAGEGYLPCTQVAQQDYYTAGVNGTDYAFWYVYRPIGDVVAILQAGVYNDGGKPLLFSPADLKVQESIAKSLRPADKQKLKGATFVGSTFDPYPEIKP